MSKLIITEKPSVAQGYAKVLGVRGRQDGYLEGSGYIISWCVGHLVELAEPEQYDSRYGKWQYADLPIIPEQWKYRVSAATKKQFGILKTLMNRSDVESIICATDAGREGELIFRLVYHQAGCKKPFERLWISSMEDSAVREGFARLRPGTEYDALYEAALCRERADWIVGINATRLFSCLYGQTLNVGRVMTPTLAMVVMRDAAIGGFVPETFYTVQLVTDDFQIGGERVKEKQLAEEIVEKCRNVGSAFVTKVEQKEKSENPPLPYDLTSLQRDANRIFGYTAQQTLDYLQELYEGKLITYPRTASNYLTDDMEDMLPGLIEHIDEEFDFPDFEEAEPDRSRIFNSSKVSDHHAIIPTCTVTRVLLDKLPPGQKKLLQLIATRLRCAVSSPYRFTETEMEAECAGCVFKTKGKTELSKGWKGIWESVYPPKNDKAEDKLPEVTEGTVFTLSEVKLKEGKTTPPKRFTEDTLLSAMESAGAEEMPEDAERKGVGTPATRAGIIEKLVQKGFVERVGDRKTKHLTATAKGSALITVVPEQIQSPSMTAEWEDKLLQVEHGGYSSEEFMREIDDMISGLVKNYEAVKGADTLMPAKGTVIGNCPACGAEVRETQKAWSCGNKDCGFALWKDNRYFKSIGKQLTASLAERLVKQGSAPLKGCVSAKTGRRYDATLVMTTDGDGRPVFSLKFDSGGKKK